MKQRKIIGLIFLAALFLISNSLIGQNDTTQFERTQEEIVKLIHLSNPTFNPGAIQKPMDSAAIADLGFEQVYSNFPQKFIMRDGKHLFSYKYEIESNTTIILLHGVLSSAYLMNKTSGLLREATNSEVIALDLRGHGQSEGTPGELDYINQYVDDLSDVIMTIKKEKPNQKIILAGHSMGGGIILRYAMENETSLVDGYILFAPHLGVNSPTIKEEKIVSGEEPFIKLHINRIIGLKMMNAIEETKYNNLPVLFFNLPETMPITKYSYRANESMSPFDYKKGLNAIDTINKCNADIVCEMSYTDIKTGQPATDHCRAALKSGKSLVTSNKGPAALFYRELSDLAKQNNVYFLIEGTVMSGTPVLNIARNDLAGNDITAIKGILNGTTNFILTNMESGRAYEDVLKEAQDLGYAEADPTADVGGFDALAKVTILANVVMGENLTPDQIPCKGISQITLNDINKARNQGKRWKLIGEIKKDQTGIKASVDLVMLDISHPLAGVNGANNAITFTTDLMGDITLVGAGAGRIETGFSILTDILEINRFKK